MFNSKDIIEALSNKEFSIAENIAKKSLAEVSLSYIGHIKNTTAKTSVTEAEEPPDKEDVQGTEEDPILDPALDREYFLKSFEEDGVLITIKTIGVGKNKPVSVYFDDVRWEMFPGPINAEKHAKEFIKSKQYDLWRGRKGLKDIESSEEENKVEVKESVNFLEAIDMTVGGKTFTVSIANTPESLQKGLMHEKSMDSNKGVLLVFDESAQHGIWMKNTHIPLDVIWVTESGTVVEVQRLEPYDEEIKYPHTPARYVLELNAGEFTGKIGDQIKLEDQMVNEITIQGRRNIARASRKTAKRRAVSAKRKKRRRKTKEELMTKARKMARDKIKKKFLKGRNENELSFAARETLEKKVNTMKGKIEKIANKMFVVAKKQEAERLKAMQGSKKDESVLNTLTKMVESQKPSTIIFDDGDSLKIKPEIAGVVLAIHEALNKRNRIKLEKMINKNSSGFKEVIEFSYQNSISNKKIGQKL